MTEQSKTARSEIIRLRRRDPFLTQAQIAEIIGCTAPYVCRVLKESKGSRVVSVSLHPEEAARLEHLSRREHLPVPTMARALLVDALNESVGDKS